MEYRSAAHPAGRRDHWIHLSAAYGLSTPLQGPAGRWNRKYRDWSGLHGLTRGPPCDRLAPMRHPHTSSASCSIFAGGRLPRFGPVTALISALFRPENRPGILPSPVWMVFVKDWNTRSSRRRAGADPRVTPLFSALIRINSLRRSVEGIRQLHGNLAGRPQSMLGSTRSGGRWPSAKVRMLTMTFSPMSARPSCVAEPICGKSVTLPALASAISFSLTAGACS